MIAATALAALLSMGAGQVTSPNLQNRPAGQPPDQHVTVIKESGQPVLPEDGYGLYRFSDHENAFGEGLQITEQFDEVSGYLTIPDPKSGRGHYSSYFLSEVKGGNGHFSFTTRQVHGVFYSFDGQVKRGSGLSRAQDAFYVLAGTLSARDDAGNAVQTRHISMKLTAQH
ncbi:hypothetical protein ACPOL_2022 [Acidisarcina polymorpha]|uniref:Uncharacterized protein n=1 Tax=Acidisarcina polymorpha TaxID=2211140 RepID=A0A2Z5FWV5_9BACT|nr:hypothetical protein [Acidisarcina polymorpha]AXC11358.1 hypothetical protein ACPOL_2022 [Acidisarcina polymorpha]